MGRLGCTPTRHWPGMWSLTPLYGRPQPPASCLCHELGEEARDDVGRDADHALRMVLVPPRMRLVVVAAPAQHALAVVVCNARVAWRWAGM